MLNDRQIVLAKQIAKEFALLNETSEDEELERAINMLSFVNDVVERAYNVIKQTISNVVEFIESLNRDDYNQGYRWYVPIKINPPPMPDIPTPRMMNIRGDL